MTKSPARAGRWLPTTLIYYLLDNQRPAASLVSNDADTSLVDNQRPAGRWLPTTLIYYLLDNQRPAAGLVTKDADLLST